MLRCCFLCRDEREALDLCMVCGRYRPPIFFTCCSVGMEALEEMAGAERKKFSWWAGGPL